MRASLYFSGESLQTYDARAPANPGARAARFLEPRILIGGVIDHQLRDDAQPALVRRGEKRLEIVQRAVVRIDVVIIRDVVAIIAQRRGIKRQQPDRGDAEFLEIIELLDQSAEIADAVAVAVVKGLDVQLVDDRVLVPKRIGSEQIIGHPLTFAKKLTHAIWRSILGREFSRQQSLFCPTVFGHEKTATNRIARSPFHWLVFSCFRAMEFGPDDQSWRRGQA